MKKVMVALLLSVVLARADEASHMKLAEEALSLMDVQKNIEQSFEAVKKMQMTQLKSMNLSAGDAGKAAETQNKVMDMIQQEYSWEKIKEDYVKIYADTFTDDELQGLIEFYKGPVGKKFIEKTPELMQRSMAVSQKQMMALMPKIQGIMKAAAPTPRLPVPPPAAQ